MLGYYYSTDLPKVDNGKHSWKEALKFALVILHYFYNYVWDLYFTLLETWCKMDPVLEISM